MQGSTHDLLAPTRPRNVESLRADPRHQLLLTRAARRLPGGRPARLLARVLRRAGRSARRGRRRAGHRAVQRIRARRSSGARCPSVWSMATPEVALEARSAGAVAVLRRVAPDALHGRTRGRDARKRLPTPSTSPVTLWAPRTPTCLVRTIRTRGSGRQQPRCASIAVTATSPRSSPAGWRALTC